MKRNLSKVILGITIIATLVIPTISNVSTQNIGSPITTYIQWPEPGDL
ncbi:hypothetical protein [Clostridium manihotivorum]|nr:hypothetical protein [Clostridium manihotivorum]